MLIRQFFRFALVGLFSNGLLYFLYLIIVKFGFSPIISMSITYLMGVIQTFFFNKKWTFKSDSRYGGEFFKYIGLYFIGYLINFFVLDYFVQVKGLDHQFVQLFMIAFLAIFLFAGQKLLVFKR